MELPIHSQIEEGMDPGPFENPLIDRREREDLFPDSPHPFFQFLRRHQERVKDGVEGIILLPVPAENPSFFLQSFE
jgi:hypothetical protein